MSHRSEQIIDAIVAALRVSTDLPIPAQNVFAHRTLSLSDDQGELPAATVNEGDDAATSDLGNDNLAFIDSLMDVAVVTYAIGTDEVSVKRALAVQRRFVHAAIMADPTLGLNFVIGVRYAGAPKPELDASTQHTVGSRESLWRVHYRMNITDPGD